MRETCEMVTPRSSEIAVQYRLAVLMVSPNPTTDRTQQATKTHQA